MNESKGVQNAQESTPPKQPAPDALINTEAGLRYWDNVEANTDGMLGGIPTVEAYSHISRTDILGSKSFLARLNIGVKGGRSKVKSAVDGGAGYASHAVEHGSLCSH